MDAGKRAFLDLPVAIARPPGDDRWLPERLDRRWTPLAADRASARRERPLPEEWPDFGPILDLLGL